MRSAAATFADVSAFNARAYAGRDYRRAICGGAFLGLGGVAAAATMAGTVAVAAAWMVAGFMSGNPALRAGAPSALEIASFPRPNMRLVDPADMFGAALAAANPAYAPAETRAAALDGAAPISAPATPPLPPQRTAELAPRVPLPAPRPVAIAQAQTEAEIAHALAVTAPPPRSVDAPAVRLDAAPPRETRIAAPTPSAAPAAAVAHASPSSPDVTGSIEAPPKRPGPLLAYNNPDSLLRPDSHTAIYDIVAHMVYLPDGEWLEAHSGLGRMLDDPHYVSERGRGATPPNVYDLTLRSGLFHGVQAIRLTPVDDSKMFGRAGILAHTYMLGPSGQSFGCVSFKDYSEFLRAFERGEVNRMIVVTHLQSPPPGVRASRDDGARYAFDFGSAH
jgi:hypothetical protein